MWTHRRSGHSHQRGTLDHRDPYEHDRTRVIHCPAFRRLQRKSQILGIHEGDFHRTRLTHSLEVASIGNSVVRSLAQKQDPKIMTGLLPHDDLIQVICLLHDIGHPPFGHSGEIALNYMMRQAGGFEGNAQTLRLLTKLEKSYGQYGLDLTRRALLGILKYPVSWQATSALQPPQESTSQMITINAWQPPKAYYDCEQAEVDWLLRPLQATDRQLLQSFAQKPQTTQHGIAAYYSFDCSVMDVADDIAYGVHDLEDTIHLRLIQREHLDTADFQAIYMNSALRFSYDQFLDLMFDREISVRKQAIGELVNYFISATQVIVTNEAFDSPLLKYNVALNDTARRLLDYLMHCIYRYMIDSQESRTYQFGGQTVVRRLFEAFNANPESLLDTPNRELYLAAQDEGSARRVVCDYIANMTDEYAHRMDDRLFGFNTSTIFQRL